MSLLRELQRRNVIRVAIAYGAAAWFVIQVIETIFPAFGFGDEAIRIAVIVLAIGFVPAVVVAWMFELTPEGVKRDADVEDHAPRSTRNFDRGIIVVLLVAVTYFAVDKFVFTATEIDDGFFGTHSIAVMPFDFDSADPKQRFFVNGVTDEIRNLLGTIRDLRVIAERSSTLFHENNIGIAEIRDRYKIGHLLEGSVRTSGSRVRVTARLVETASETQLWSDVYEREVDDIFRIQDDIARNVLHNLKIELDEPLRQSRNINPEAYALVQQANGILQAMGEDVGARMYEVAKRAYELDPDYPDAVATLSVAEFMRARDGLVPWDEARAAWEALDARFAELAPERGYIEAGKAWEYEREGKWELAADWYLRSLAKELTDSEQIRLAGRFALLLNRQDLAVRILELGAAIDPLNHQVRRILSQALMFRGASGDYERAIEVREDYLAKASGGQPFYSQLLLLTGREDEVAAVWADDLDRFLENATPYLAMADYSAGDTDAALARLAALEEKLAEEPDRSSRRAWHLRINLASANAWMGDADEALGHLMPPSEHVSYTDKLDVYNPVWQKITDDPRWLEYREAIGMSPERLAAIKFDPWLPE